MEWIHDEDRTECWENGRMLASVHPIRTTAPGPTGWEVVIYRPKPAGGFRYFIEHYRTHALAMAAARTAVQVYY